MSEAVHIEDVDTVVTTTFSVDRSPNCSLDPDINAMFLRTVQNYLNDKLKIQGHVFLNEVFDELGLTRTSQGQLVGWLFSNGNDVVWQYETNEENVYSLTFNVDGVIYDKLEGRDR